MPNFNEFRLNEELYAELVSAKREMDFSNTVEENLEVSELVKEHEAQKREDSKPLYVKIAEKILGKKFIRFEDRYGNKHVREYDPNYVYAPQIKIKKTIERPIDFGDELGEWRKHIQEEAILLEEKKLYKQEQEKIQQSLVEIYAFNIQQQMMKIS